MVSKFQCLQNHRTSPLRQPSHKVCLIYVKFEFNLFQSISDLWVRLTLDSRLSSWKCWSVRETRGRRTARITTQSLFSDPISLGQTALWLIAWVSRFRRVALSVHSVLWCPHLFPCFVSFTLYTFTFMKRTQLLYN